MKLVTETLGLGKSLSASTSSRQHLKSKTQSIKTTSFFSTVQSSKSSKSQTLYLTMEDLDQRSIRNFSLSSQFVAGLLGINLLYMMLTFTLQRSTLVKEDLACKACNISLTYLLFFLNAAYLALTVRNLKIFSGPKDFKNVLFVRSKKFVLGLFAGITGVTCLLGQTTSVLCENIRFPVYTLCMVVCVSQTLILLANFKIANEIRKDCEFSIAMESEESASVSGQGTGSKVGKNSEKFEGSFCIYRSSKRNRRKKWRGRRHHQKGRNNKNYNEFDNKANNASNKNQGIISNADIFENDKDEAKQVENKVTNVNSRRSRYSRKNKHPIRGIRISFGPKTHSQDSISTQTSESPNQSQNSGFNEFDQGNPSTKFESSPMKKKIQKNNIAHKTSTSIEFEMNFKNKIKDNVSEESSDSIEDLEEFELEIDNDFKDEGRNGTSFYTTPTKRLEEQFRKVWISDKKEDRRW